MGSDLYMSPPAPSKFVLLVRLPKSSMQPASEAQAAIYKFQSDGIYKDASENWQRVQLIGGKEQVESARKVAMVTNMKWVGVPYDVLLEQEILPGVMREYLHPTPPKPPKPVTVSRDVVSVILHAFTPEGGNSWKAIAGDGHVWQAFQSLQKAFDESAP